MAYRYLFCLLIVFSASNFSYAQSTSDYAIQLTATVQQSPAKIILSWQPVAGVTTYTIFRKAKTGTSWGTALAS